MVYVDDPIHPYGRMVMCHMIADSLEELHAMAEKIGIPRKWVQTKSRCIHYDICKSKRKLAIKHGAQVCDREAFVTHMRRIQKKQQEIAASWNRTTDKLPPHSKPVIGYSSKWVDEDFNPKGVRECFLTGDGTEWVTALWIDYQDTYSRCDDGPEYWCEYPEPLFRSE